jgi:NAD(P)-dependent dehydrogenase (short-subunit alcohol dehydrogenase family)
MFENLNGKVAIITGGSNGIGKACVERLCKEGCKVTFSGISEAGFKTEKEFVNLGYEVHFVRGDIGEEATCSMLIEETVKKWGKLNYLVNNAFAFTAKGY